MKAYLVDDEPLAVSRLRDLLEETGRVEICGGSSDPGRAVEDLQRLQPDVVFLDIEMPGMSGFDLLDRLGDARPLIVFVTAYDRYALDAFKVNSIDYLLKPVEPEQVCRSLDKIDRMLRGTTPRGDVDALLSHMRAILAQREPEHPVRLASRAGDRVTFIEIAQVTHFYAKDKLTFAVTSDKEHALDLSITELEQTLPPKGWVRIHRSMLLNVDAIKELRSWFGGKLLIKLKDGKTELQVPRDRAAEVRSKLGV
jgi:two-component system, LytTR family, response regulator